MSRFFAICNRQINGPHAVGCPVVVDGLRHFANHLTSDLPGIQGTVSVSVPNPNGNSWHWKEDQEGVTLYGQSHIWGSTPTTTCEITARAIKKPAFKQPGWEELTRITLQPDPQRERYVDASQPRLATLLAGWVLAQISASKEIHQFSFTAIGGHMPEKLRATQYTDTDGQTALLVTTLEGTCVCRIDFDT